MYRANIRILTLILPLSFSYSQINIAVMPLDARGVSSLEASVLSDRLALELFDTGKYTVLERENMQAILNEQDFQLTGCVSEECVIEVGKLLGVESIIAGSVSKIGDTFTIGLRLIDVETGAIGNVASYDYRGSIDQLLSIGMRSVAQILSDKNESALNGKFEKAQNPSLRPTTQTFPELRSVEKLNVLASFPLTEEKGYGLMVSRQIIQAGNIFGINLRPTGVLGYLYRKTTYQDEPNEESRVYIGLGINSDIQTHPEIGFFQTGIGYGMGYKSREEINLEYPEGTGRIISSEKPSVLLWANYYLPLRIGGLSILVGVQFITSSEFMEVFTITSGLAF